MTGALSRMAAEGAVDRLSGRPRERNSYHHREARDALDAWAIGWDEADALLELRAAAEAAQWLRAA